MKFGQAIEHVKLGGSAAREGWNGKDMFIYLNKGSRDFSAGESGPISGVDPALFERGHQGTVTRLPNINMKAADGSTVTGWLASQTDMLAEDWLALD